MQRSEYRRDSASVGNALFAVWYSFCRRHQTINSTPAIAAGLADEPWSLERLLTKSAGMAA